MDTTLNTKPIFTAIPRASWATADAANTALDGSGTIDTTIWLLWAAEAAAGSYVNEFRVYPLGAVGTATVVRIFLNNGSTIATAANNTLLKEIQVPVTDAMSQTVAREDNIWQPDNGQIPPGYKLYVSISQAITDGIHIAAIGGDYAE